MLTRFGMSYINTVIWKEFIKRRNEMFDSNPDHFKLMVEFLKSKNIVFCFTFDDEKIDVSLLRTKLFVLQTSVFRGIYILEAF